LHKGYARIGTKKEKAPEGLITTSHFLELKARLDEGWERIEQPIEMNSHNLIIVSEPNVLVQLRNDVMMR
jgi:hypothetical protein